MQELGSALNAISQKIIGAAIEAHRILGPGFLESVYEEALSVELELRGVRFVRQVSVPLEYKGRRLKDHVLDIFVEEQVVVELKAVDALLPIHSAQVLSYLKATGCKLGLLINFNSAVLKDGIKRLIRS